MKRFLTRTGGMFAAPRSTLGAMLHETPAGARDFIIVLMLLVAVLRFPALVRVAWYAVDVSAMGSLSMLLGIVASVARLPVLVVLGGTLALWLAGRHHGAGRAFDLAASCAIWPLTLALLGKLALRAAPAFENRWVAFTPSVVGGLWYLALLALAVRVVRRGPTADALSAAASTDKGQRVQRRARLVGTALLALLVAGVMTRGVRLASQGCTTLRPASAGHPAPDVALPTLAGPPLRLAALRGKVVVIDFWASWCPPCIASFPVLEQLQDEFGPRGMQVVAINIEGDRRRARDFVDRRTHARSAAGKAASRVVVALDNGSAGDRYGVATIPHFVLIGRDGQIRYVHAGMLSESALREEIATALAQDAP